MKTIFNTSPFFHRIACNFAPSIHWIGNLKINSVFSSNTINRSKFFPRALLKVIVPFICLFVFPSMLGAQDISTNSPTDLRSRLCFGFKFGLNYSNVYDTKGEDFFADPKFGLALGAFASIPIGPYFGIQPEFLFSQKGFKSSGAMLGQRYELIRTTNYLDVPLMFVFKPGEFISVMAGPQYSYLTKQIDEVKTSSTSVQQTVNFENSDLRKNTFCFVGGVDFTMKHFVLGARVGADLLRNVGSNNSSDPRYKNSWFQATLAYRFYRP